MRTLRNLLMIALPMLLVTSLMMTGCKKKTEEAVVDSGTYEGTITKVNPEETEIYVDSKGQELELYFTEKTKLTQAGQPAEFSALKKGQNVKVEVKKVGQRLDPISVNILE